MSTLRGHIAGDGELPLRFNLPSREITLRALTAGAPVRLNLLPGGIHLMPTER
jgi:hypothetical protein